MLIVTSVVVQGATVEQEPHLVRWDSGLQFTQRLEVLQFQVVAHFQRKDVVGQRRHRHLHRLRFQATATTTTTTAIKHTTTTIETATTNENPAISS